MSQRTSRLSTLLRVRRIQEEIRRGRLGAEMAAERGTRNALRQAHQRYAAPAAEPLMEAESTRGFVAQRFHRVALAVAVRAAAASVDDAAQVTVLAAHDWTEAAIRMAALERLDDRAREAARKERLAVEQRASEESSSARRGRGRTAGVRGERR
jgi:flagellar biosynthesis chaperone FliJ